MRKSTSYAEAWADIVGYGIMFVIIFSMFLILFHFSHTHDETGIITDKIVRQLYGTDRYYFQIDNSTIIYVTFEDYYKYEIGDNYTYAVR